MGRMARMLWDCVGMSNYSAIDFISRSRSLLLQKPSASYSRHQQKWKWPMGRHQMSDDSDGQNFPRSRAHEIMGQIGQPGIRAFTALSCPRVSFQHQEMLSLAGQGQGMTGEQGTCRDPCQAHFDLNALCHCGRGRSSGWPQRRAGSGVKGHRTGESRYWTWTKRSTASSQQPLWLLLPHAQHGATTKSERRTADHSKARRLG
jgi:hypothetical protein